MTSRESRQTGISLLELILAMVVIGIVLSAVASVYIVSVQHSVDPMVRQQAQFIAESYLEEILLKKFVDPDSNRVCPTPEATRDLYDNVCDYDGLSEAPTDQTGTPLAGISGYAVQVAITRDGTVTLNGLTNGPAANELRVLRVDVTVTGPLSTSVALSGYRTNYNCNVSTDAGCANP